jgi:hypothetical protein
MLSPSQMVLCCAMLCCDRRPTMSQAGESDGKVIHPMCFDMCHLPHNLCVPCCAMLCCDRRSTMSQAGESDGKVIQRLNDNEGAFARLTPNAVASQLPRLQVRAMSCCAVLRSLCICFAIKCTACCWLLLGALAHTRRSRKPKCTVCCLGCWYGFGRVLQCCFRAVLCPQSMCFYWKGILLLYAWCAGSHLTRSQASCLGCRYVVCGCACTRPNSECHAILCNIAHYACRPP